MNNDSARFDRLNKSTPTEKLGEELHKTKNTLLAVYDFAVQGGAVSTVKLLDDKGEKAILPANALITTVQLNVPTAVLSAGSATVAIGAASTNDLCAATAKATLAAAAKVDGTPVNTAATSVKLAAAVQVSATIGTAALTAGKIYVMIEYVILPS